MRTVSFLSNTARRLTTSFARRDIAVGTDLTKSSASLQKARPWFMSDDEGSNMAADNELKMSEIFPPNKSVAVFGVPAPFTGTCTTAHYPPYKQLADDFFSSQVDAILCYSVTDPFAHYNWAVNMGNDFDKIQFVADPTCEWAKEFELDADYSVASLGTRSKRFSMLVRDGKVVVFHDLTGKDASEDAPTLLQDAKGL